MGMRHGVAFGWTTKFLECCPKRCPKRHIRDFLGCGFCLNYLILDGERAGARTRDPLIKSQGDSATLSVPRIPAITITYCIIVLYIH